VPTPRLRQQHADLPVRLNELLKKLLRPGPRVWSSEVTLLLLLISSTKLLSQSTGTTYHLHQEASSTGGLFQLKTAGPDTGSVAIQSTDLKNQPAGEYLLK